jgi:hypothetical protein
MALTPRATTSIWEPCLEKAKSPLIVTNSPKDAWNPLTITSAVSGPTFNVELTEPTVRRVSTALAVLL